MLLPSFSGPKQTLFRQTRPTTGAAVRPHDRAQTRYHRTIRRRDGRRGGVDIVAGKTGHFALIQREIARKTHRPFVAQTLTEMG
jgi:hypothetical protein